MRDEAQLAHVMVESWRKLRRRKSIRQAGTNCNCRLTEREEEMNKKLSMLGVALLALSSVAWAASQAEKATKAATAEKTYYVAVSDSNCGLKHATAGAEAAACVAKCVQGGAKYVAVYRGKVYQLESQDKFADFAGKRAKIMGTRKIGRASCRERVEVEV